MFDRSYDDADHDYLNDSLTRFDHVAVARHDGAPVGFALADVRIMNLPRLPDQVVARAGLACVDPGLRRRGVVASLVAAAARAACRPELVRPRRLPAGRFAHPGSFRMARDWPGLVPQAGLVPTAWQQQVGAVLAKSLGASDFVGETFVCIGTGQPIGQPVVSVQANDQDWRVFEGVERGRGDTLLGLGWFPNPPRDGDQGHDDRIRKTRHESARWITNMQFCSDAAL